MTGFPVYHQLPEIAQTDVGDDIQPSHPLSSLLLQPSIFPRIRVFSNESALLIRWPKYWNFSFSVSPSNEYSGVISFRLGFPCGSAGKESACNAGDLGSIAVLGRSAREVKVKVKIAQSCLTLCDPMDCSPPAPLSLEFSRPEYWSGSAFPFSSRSSQHSD